MATMGTAIFIVYTVTVSYCCIETATCDCELSHLTLHLAEAPHNSSKTECEQLLISKVP